LIDSFIHWHGVYSPAKAVRNCELIKENKHNLLQLICILVGLIFLLHIIAQKTVYIFHTIVQMGHNNFFSMLQNKDKLKGKKSKVIAAISC
jgi:ABC-type sulfate transport system permease subunit